VVSKGIRLSFNIAADDMTSVPGTADTMELLTALDPALLGGGL
jgi:hypothetical protein